MSGASGAYLNGHLSDRERNLVRRKDLDISELLELCAEPLGIDERVETIQKYSAIYPELKLFLIVACFCKTAFSQVNLPGLVDYKPSNVPKGGSVENLKSMWSEITKLYDTYPSGPKIKRGRAWQLLSSLYKDDAEVVSKLIHGTYYRKELNEIVVSKAFPQDTPQLPKI